MERNAAKEEADTRNERFNLILAGIYIGTVYIRNPDFKPIKHS